jgi:hypothetical protein
MTKNCDTCGCELKTKNRKAESCAQCTTEMMEAERQFKAAQTAEFARRKCRKCGGPCTVGRYFICGACESDLPTEDPYTDGADDMDWGDEPVVARVLPTSKKCSGCRKTLCLSLFGRNALSKDKRNGACKACNARHGFGHRVAA